MPGLGRPAFSKPSGETIRERVVPVSEPSSAHGLSGTAPKSIGSMLTDSRVCAVR